MPPGLDVAGCMHNKFTMQRVFGISTSRKMISAPAFAVLTVKGINLGSVVKARHCVDTEYLGR